MPHISVNTPSSSSPSVDGCVATRTSTTISNASVLQVLLLASELFFFSTIFFPTHHRRGVPIHSTHWQDLVPVLGQHGWLPPAKTSTMTFKQLSRMWGSPNTSSCWSASWQQRPPYLSHLEFMKDLGHDVGTTITATRIPWPWLPTSLVLPLQPWRQHCHTRPHLSRKSFAWSSSTCMVWPTTSTIWQRCPILYSFSYKLVLCRCVNIISVDTCYSLKYEYRFREFWQVLVLMSQTCWHPYVWMRTFPVVNTQHRWASEHTILLCKCMSANVFS